MKHYERQHNTNEFNTIYALDTRELKDFYMDTEKVLTIKQVRTIERHNATDKINRAKRLALSHGFKTIEMARLQAQKEYASIWADHRLYHKPNADDYFELDMWLHDFEAKWEWLGEF